MNNLKTVTLASAAALFAMTAVALPTVASAADASVHCFGVNSCKGQSDCKSGNHDCKGQNACKGQGYKSMSSDACTKAGGKTSP